MKTVLNISEGLKENQFIIPRSIRTSFKDGKLIVTYDIGDKFSEEFLDSMKIGEIYKVTFYKDPDNVDSNVWIMRYNGRQGNILNSQSYIAPSIDQKHIVYSHFRPLHLVNIDEYPIISIQPVTEAERNAYNFIENKYAEKANSYKMYASEIYAENWKKHVEIFQKMTK